jgi:error-prone DNA polymerase
VRGLAEEDGRRLVEAREAGAETPEAFARAGVSRRGLTLLAEADAFRSLGLDRRAALWAVKGLDFAAGPKTAGGADAPLLALAGPTAETPVTLPALRLREHVAEDYRTHGLSLKAHPCRFFRKALADRGVIPCADLKDERLRQGRRVAVAGLVLIRQRPGTARGVVFLTLEDETGPANVVIWPDRFEASRKTVMTSSFLLVRGRIEREGEVIHIAAESFEDLSAHLQRLRPGRDRTSAAAPAAERLQRSRDFH